MAGVLAALEPVADAAGIVLEAGPVEARVRVDADRFTQVLTNLVGNAVKFTPRGGLVRVEAVVRDGAAEVSVTDTGPGIPREAQETVFERFRQLDESDVRQRDGSGLGLAISRSLVEHQGGRIWVDSEPGHGASFRFTVPLAASASAPVPGASEGGAAGGSAQDSTSAPPGTLPVARSRVTPVPTARRRAPFPVAERCRSPSLPCGTHTARRDHDRDHGTSCGAPRRRPRPDPGAGRPGEQPQGRERRAAQAAAHRLHRRLGVGQELAGLRHHRRGVAADDQRDLQRLRAGLHALAGAPEVDRLEGLTTAIIVDQERMGANPRSTVGTATDAHAMLRILFSRLGSPYVGPPTAFSFNVPTRRASGVMSTERAGRTEKSVVKGAVYLGGMCPRCEGTGSVKDIDLTALYDDTLSLADGALSVPGYSMDGWYGRLFAGMGLPMDAPISTFTAKQLDTMLHAEPTKIKVEGVNLTFEGIIPKIQKSMLSKDPRRCSPTCGASSTARSPSRPARTARARG